MIGRLPDTFEFFDFGAHKANRCRPLPEERPITDWTARVVQEDSDRAHGGGPSLTRSRSMAGTPQAAVTSTATTPPPSATVHVAIPGAPSVVEMSGCVARKRRGPRKNCCSHLVQRAVDVQDSTDELLTVFSTNNTCVYEHRGPSIFREW